MQTLPIEALLPSIERSLRTTPNLVIEAPPGAGKTTRVPPFLLDARLSGEGEVWVLEPRRLATRLSARRVAEERGERPGETVGYQVRFEDVSGPRTRLRYLTEGVLTRKLLTDPQLKRVGAVVLDEFHERHLTADLALALLRRLQLESRPELRLVVMSATLDAGPIAEFLGQCPVLRSEGRRFAVEVEHLPRPDERPLAAQVESALGRLLKEETDGDVLVFLPGAAEIRRAQEMCGPMAERAGRLMLPLHGDLPAAEQERAVRPADRRKVILSTNVAETSVTIEGVTTVIDSGLARIAGHSPWSGMPTLEVARISQAAAVQRAGRAGRTRPGRCLRLYTAQDFNARPAHEEPEIRRLDLAEPVLELHAAGITDASRFNWFEPPSAHALAAAERLLGRLGALDAGGQLTTVGRRMLRLPLHPRLARMLVEAEARDVADHARIIAALVSERDIRANQTLLERRGQRVVGPSSHGPSDLLELLDLFHEAERAAFAPERLREMRLNPSAARAADRVRRQLERVSDGSKNGHKERSKAELSTESETRLLVSILTGYPDRVARRREMVGTNDSEVEFLLAGGGGAASLAPESVVRRASFIVAVDAEERRESGRRGRGGTLIRLASAIEPEWLLDLYTEAVTETREPLWNELAQRVEVVSRLIYDGLTLDESRASEATGPEVSKALAEAALAAGVHSFIEREAIDSLLARISFVHRAFPEQDFPLLTEEDVRESLVRLCQGRRSFAELRLAAASGGLLEELRRKLSPEQLRSLSKMAPERLTLARGRQVRVNYADGQPPWIASRLQDFFGMKEGPRVAGGRVPVVLHLLAPNNRPVQVTQDLEGFWARHYPEVRRQLSRRYPRHPWPELQP